MAREPVFRLPEAVVPAGLQLPERAGRKRPGRPGGQGSAALCRAPVDRCELSGEFPGDQSRGLAQGDRNQGREPHQGARKPDRRCGQRPHQPDRRVGLRDRPQHRRDARLGRLRERTVPADPVRAHDRDGRQAAAGHGAAVHQQVLHPRPAAREFLRGLCSRRGPHRVHGFVAQREGRPRPPHLGRLRRQGRDRGAAGRARHCRQRQGECTGLLRRRHAARRGAQRAQCPERILRLERDLPHHDAGFRRHRPDRMPRRRAGRAVARTGHRRRRHPAGVRARLRLFVASRQRPHLVVRRQQLPQGRIARRVRPALLERGQHQPARADVLLVCEEHLPREQAVRAGRADQLRCACGPRLDRPAELPPRFARGPHRAVEERIPVGAAPRGANEIRASGQRAYRGRRQSRVEEQAQLLGFL